MIFVSTCNLRLSLASLAPPLFLATKVAISFVYCSPKAIKCTQKPKIGKKFTGIDQSSERASAIPHIVSTTRSCACAQFTSYKNHPGRLQGKFSYKKVIRMLEVQHDTDGHGALRLYISKIFRRMLLYFSCSKHGWIELRTVNNIWHPFRESPDNLTGPKPYSERKI